MARAIDADSFRNEMNEYIYPIIGNNLIGGADVFYRVLHLLEDAPTIDPVKHGEWVHVADNSTGKILQCTNCSYYYNPNKKDVKSRRITERPKHCMNCGARMDGE